MAETDPARMRVLYILWTAQTLSLIGTDLTRFAVGIWTYENVSDNVSDYAWVIVYGEAPALLLAPLTGLLVDRVSDKRMLLILVDALSLTASMFLFLHYHNGTLSKGEVYMVNAAQSICNSIQWPAFMAAFTSLVKKSDLVKLGAVNEALPALVMLIAPSISGTILAYCENDLTAVFAIEFVTCVLAILATMGSGLTTTEIQGEGKQTLVQGVVEPFGFLLTQPGLLLLLAYMTVFSFTTGMVRILFTPLIMAFSNASAVAAVLTLSGTGAIFGSIALSKFTPHSPVRILMVCSAAQGALLSTVGLYPSSLLILVVAFLYMSLIPAVRVCRQAIFQHMTPVGMQGRIFAIQRAIREGSVPLAGIVAGSIADMLEPLMSDPTASSLAATFGPIVGFGKGRGIALLFFISGAIYSMISMVGLAQPLLKRLDNNFRKETHAKTA